MTQYFSASKGGGETVFFNFAEGMSKRGHQVDVICHKVAGQEIKQIDGINVHELEPAIIYKGGLPPSIKQNLSFVTKATLTGSKIIRRKRVDLIHANTYSPVLAAKLLGTLFRLPVISTIHDIFKTPQSSSYWHSWSVQTNVSRTASIIGPVVEKVTVKMPVSAIHTVSNASKDDLIAFGARSPITVIPNGLDLSYYDYPSTSIDFQPDVVFVGRLVFYKNLDIVIIAFRDIVKKIPTARLIVIGDGPMRPVWEEMVEKYDLKDHVEFKGHVSHEAKVEAIAKSSVLVLPSTFEGFGIVLLEAFALHKPVVVAKVPPFDEIVDDGVDGFLLSNEPKVWAEKLSLMLSNGALCKAMGQKARQKLESKFMIQRVIAQLESLYTKVVANQGKSSKTANHVSSSFEAYDYSNLEHR